MEAKGEDLRPEDLVLKHDDLDNLLVNRGLLWYDVKGVKVYCPYGHPSKFPAGQNEMSDKVSKIVSVMGQAGAEVAVFSVVNVVKKDVELASGTTLTMPDRDRRVWWSKMAQKIVSKFEFAPERPSAVMAAASRSPMAKALAEMCAAGLRTPVIDALKKTTDPSKISINEERFSRWAEGKPQKKVDSFRQDLEANLRTMRNKTTRGETSSIADDVSVTRREFFDGIHDVVPGALDGVEGPVLVVDDNVDSGATLADIQRLLKRDFGKINPLFAGGFRINRSR